MPAHEDNRSYFERRAQACRERAEAAKDPSIQQLHIRFATAYERRARAETEYPPEAA
ncbi:hypothetical protein [Sphingomonas sp.]|uniref:hypothetical protein n=1 Tax=Sphingomonas sp. TaxID=28214 RepID=UPI003B3A4EE9